MKVANHTTAAVLTEPVKQASGDVRPLIHTVKAGLATVPVDGNELPEEIARELRRLLAAILVRDVLQEQRGDLAARVGPVHRSNPRQEEDA